MDLPQIAKIMVHLLVVIQMPTGNITHNYYTNLNTVSSEKEKTDLFQLFRSKTARTICMHMFS